jgi:hypothetical protein
MLHVGRDLDGFFETAEIKESGHVDIDLAHGQQRVSVGQVYSKQWPDNHQSVRAVRFSGSTSHAIAQATIAGFLIVIIVSVKLKTKLN